MIPGSTDAMSWRIGDNGFTMTLSAQVPEIIKTQLKPWLEQWLNKHDLSLPQVSTWAIHPGGPRIVSAAATALGLGKMPLRHRWTCSMIAAICLRLQSSLFCNVCWMKEPEAPVSRWPLAPAWSSKLHY